MSDINFLKSENYNRYLPQCKNCNEFGHKQGECVKECVFTTVKTSPDN